jgi:nucleotide-binding universal stress UspA family protein
MYRKVLLPVDGSTFAEHALPYAFHAVRRSGAELILALVHVQRVPATIDITLREELQRWETEYIEQESDYLAALAERIGREQGITPVTRLLHGGVVAALEREVEREGVDLVVMTTHGRAGLDRAWLGSVADGLVRHLDVPVLLVRPSDGEPAAAGAVAGCRNVLIALDGSERAERAIAPALALCDASAQITLLRAVAPPAGVMSPFMPHAARLTREELESRQREAEEYLAGQRRLLEAGGVTVSTAAPVGYHAARVILDHAVTHGAELIALGTHGRGAVARLMLGSVSDKVVRAADVPVLLC